MRNIYPPPYAQIIRQKLFIFDAALPDLLTLTSVLPTDAEIHFIDAEKDGVEQLALILQGRTDIDALHIFTHGSAGSLLLGNTSLSLANLNNYALPLSHIGSALSPTGDILLYGCNVAAGEDGRAFVEELSQMTGADVAASDDVTGATALGGDWALEAQSGVVESEPMAVVGFDGVMANSAPTIFAPLVNSLGTATEFATGDNTMSVVSGDVNGDGKVDLIAANFGSIVSVLLNTGNGVFGSPVKYSFEFSNSSYYSVDATLLYDVALADFNGDGMLDLAITRIFSYKQLSFSSTTHAHQVVIRLNNGYGLFTSSVSYSTGSTYGDNFSKIVTGDFNNDGYVDLATTHYDSDFVSVFINRGNGTFNAAVHYSTGTSPSGIITTDINSDGKLDLVVTNYRNGNISVLKGNGSGTFATKVDYATVDEPIDIASGDFNTDGKVDLVVANFSGNNFSLLLNNGDGTFATKKDYAIGSSPSFSPSSIATTDVNADGKLDVLVTNGNDDTVSVFLGNGDGFFAVKQNYTTGDVPRDVITPDVNGDTYSDVVVANYRSNTVSVFLNSVNLHAATSFTEQNSVLVCSDIVVNDADGNASWNGGTLSVEISSNAEVVDTLSLPTANPGNNGIWLNTTGNKLMAGTTEIGTANAALVQGNASWLFTLNTNATNAFVQNVARAITFKNNSDTPSALARFVTFTVTDNLGAETSATQQITINALDDATMFGGSDTGTVTEDSGAYSLSGTLTLINSSSATFLSQLNTAGSYGSLSIGTNGAWSYTATNSKLQPLVGNSAATDLFTVKTSDGFFHNIIITLNGVNDAPTGSVTITGTPTQGETLTASNTLADADGIPTGAISYQWLASGSNISGAIGSSYTLTASDVGKTITVKANYTDGSGTAESVASTATSVVTGVTPTNHAPTVANALVDQNATQSTAFSYVIPVNSFTDFDAGTVLTYSATLSNGSPLPGWLTLNAITRTFSGTPTNSDVGTVSVKVTASDGSLSTNDTFDIATTPNTAPVLAFDDASGAITEMDAPSGTLSDSGTISFTDADLSDVHTVSVSPASSGASGTLTASITADTTGTGEGGEINWTYSVDAATVTYLGEGEQKIEAFTVVLVDSDGNSATRVVEVAITGTETTSTVDLSGSVTFWKTGAAITGVTTTLTSLPHETEGQLVELRNIQHAADGSYSIEIWKTSPQTDISDLQLEFNLPEGSLPTWESANTLPDGWALLASTTEPGQVLLGGFGVNTLSADPMLLGTLTLSAPSNTERFEIALTNGKLAETTVPAFRVFSETDTTSTDGLYEFLNVDSGAYLFDASKVAEASLRGTAVTSGDALAALKIALLLNPNSDGSTVLPYQYLAADVNKDGRVTSGDALNILKMAIKYAGAPEQEWLFVDESVGSTSMSRNSVVWPTDPITIDLDTDMELDLIGIVKGDINGSFV